MCRIGNEMKLKLPAGGALWLNTTMLNHNFKNDKTKHKQWLELKKKGRKLMPMNQLSIKVKWIFTTQLSTMISEVISTYIILI